MAYATPPEMCPDCIGFGFLRLDDAEYKTTTFLIFQFETLVKPATKVKCEKCGGAGVLEKKISLHHF